ncbi:MAG: NACHT domain-containing protein [Chloroflexi bacterium]|nr:NACHT domain-containing protein [Chloroflexota bacterium]
MDVPQSRALQHLRSMSEIKLHTEVINPLLLLLASHVRYVHGSEERGKDFVYVTKDELGDSVLQACQVKNTPLTGRASSSVHTVALLTQLRQCRELLVLNPETHLKEKPQVVSLWTMYPLPEKDTADSSELLGSLRHLQCKIVGPEKIVQLVEKHMPEYFQRIAYSGSGLAKTLRIYVDIHHEAEAFDVQRPRRLSEIFVSIGVGTQATEPGVETEEELETQIRRRLYDLVCDLEGAIPKKARKAPILKVLAGEKKRQSLEIEVDSVQVKPFAKSVQSYISREARSSEIAKVQSALDTLVLANQTMEAVARVMSGTSNVRGGRRRRFHVPGLRVERVPTSVWAHYPENLVIVGGAGVGKTTFARMLAQAAIDADLPCVYFPCSTINRPEMRLRECMIGFLKSLAPGVPSQTIKSYLDRADLIILDGCDEAATFRIALGDEINRLSFPGPLSQQVGETGQGEQLSVPADLLEMVVHDAAKGTLGIRNAIRKLDIDRLIAANPDEHIQQKLTELQERYCQHGRRVVLTTREADSLELNGSFVPLYLLPFDNKQLDDFFEQWCKGTTLRAELIRDYLDDHPRLREVCRRPMVATILAGLFEGGHDPPHSRAELYEARFNLLLTGRWDRLKKVSVRMRVRERDKYMLLMRLALQMHLGHRRTFATEDVAELWNQGFSRNYPGISVADVLIELEVSNSVIVRVGSGSFSLGHLSFQEFLAARAIVFSQQQRVLVNHLYDPWWSDVALYFAGLSGDVSSLLSQLQGDLRLYDQERIIRDIVEEARFTDPVVLDFLQEAFCDNDRQNYEDDGE